MANKTDGITELTKLLVSASKKFSKTEYNRLSSVFLLCYMVLVMAMIKWINAFLMMQQIYMRLHP